MILLNRSEDEMRGALLLAMVLLAAPSLSLAQRASPVPGDSAELVAYDSTSRWQFPYEVSPERRQQLVDAFRSFRTSGSLPDLLARLGRADRVENLSQSVQTLSPFEDGFVDGSRGRLSYRFVWFARRLSRSPGISDSFLVAYIGADKTKLVAVRGNWLK